MSGVTGQDGAYLSELLLSKGYVVHGIKRKSSMFNTQRVDHIYQDPHALIRRFAEAYKAGTPEVAVWGCGKPRREFGGKFCHLNLGTGTDVSIADSAGMVAKAVGLEGKIVFDASKPDGTLRKLQDVRRVRDNLGCKPRKLEAALGKTVRMFQSISGLI